MKTKTKLIISTLSVLFIAALAIGTVAYFSKSFASDGNTAYAASFDVDVINADGTTIGDGQFNLGDELYPGMDPIEAYSFEINKNNTELPVEYQVNLTPSGDLFPQDGGSPILVTMQQNIDGEWVEIDYTKTFKPENNSEAFRILVEWPHGDNDIDFQGLTGNFQLEVVATQVDPEEEPEGPPYFTGEVVFKATPNGSTRSTTNKEVDFYFNDEGFRVFEVDMGDGTGEFEDNVGNFKVVEQEDHLGTWFRVYTDNEYYASESQMWRIRTEALDTSQQGTLLFPKTGKNIPRLSIESQALYDWFTK